MSQSEVTVLDDHVEAKHKPAMPPVLHSLRQSVEPPLNELLQGLFNNADNALFEMADRAHNASDQNVFFESMRKLRLNRERITDDFIKGFYSDFDDLFTPVSVKPLNNGEEFDEHVNRLEEDEREISVAITGMTSKITSQFALPIVQLTKRIDHLCQQKSAQPVIERTNPLGPQRLCKAFVNALQQLNVDIKVRIVLLKLYERFVMERLGPVYEQANDMLIDAGVLPDLKKVKRKSRNAGGLARAPRSAAQDDYAKDCRSSADTESHPVAGHPVSGSYVLFDDIQRLLASTRPLSGAGSIAADAPAISTPQLLSVLSSIQQDYTSQSADIEQQPQMIDLQQLVSTRALDITGEPQSSMQQADDDAVNFVGLLFDYILNDRNLAIPIKTLIARLQIPIVKLSIIDKSFFVKTSHPARQLLNELSSAGIGWSSTHELKRDALYDKIESVVLRVLNGFSDNPEIFAELVCELRGYITTDEKRSAIVEKRVKQTEEGKAKTNAAKQLVQKIINEKASGLRLPPQIGRFISETWSKVLVYLYVKHGTESETWNAGLKSLDDLLWCIQPVSSARDLELRDEVASELIARLDQGMDQIVVASRKREACLVDIQKLLEQVAENDRAFLEHDADFVQDESFEQLEAIVLTAPEASNRESVPPDPEFLDQIEALSEGVWVELQKSPGDSIRCKLAMVVQPGDVYVFVNHRGMKVAERSRSGLAVDLKRGALSVLEESQVFGRALQAVIGNLRQMR